MQDNQHDNIINLHPDPESRARTAAYIADLVREMAALAQKEQIEPLRRLLLKAHEEASRTARA